MDTTTFPPPKSPNRFFDVVPPNKTVPDASSRPIIVSSQPGQSDPMVTATAPPVTTNIPLSPPSSDQLPSLADESETLSIVHVNQVPAEPPQTNPLPIELPKPEPPPAEPAQTETVSAEEPAPAPVSLPTSNNDLHEIAMDLPAAKPSGVVVVHHGYSSQTLRNIITISLIILMLVVIADLVLDIGYVKSGIIHTHFFGG